MRNDRVKVKSVFLCWPFFADYVIGIPVLRTTVWSNMKALTALHCRTDPGQFGPEPFRPGTPQSKSFVFNGFSRAGTAFSSNNINFDFGSSIEVKRNVSKYHNQKRMLHSKGLQGSITLERNARKYHNKTNYTEV